MSKEENYNLIEYLSKEVHNSWWREKRKQGFHAPINCNQATPNPAVGKEEAKEKALTKHCEKCHPNMYEYNSLPENVKKYDRETVKTVLGALSEYFNSLNEYFNNGIEN